MSELIENMTESDCEEELRDYGEVNVCDDGQPGDGIIEPNYPPERWWVYLHTEDRCLQLNSNKGSPSELEALYDAVRFVRKRLLRERSYPPIACLNCDVQVCHEGTEPHEPEEEAF